VTADKGVGFRNDGQLCTLQVFSYGNVSAEGGMRGMQKELE